MVTPRSTTQKISWSTSEEDVRDQFAIAAMRLVHEACLARKLQIEFDGLARESYRLADEMMKAREADNA